MPRFIRNLLNCLLLLSCCLLCFSNFAVAGEKEDRIQLLQEKMKILKAQLERVQDARLREQPPSEIPWQPIQSAGEERAAYAHYVYLLGAQMAKEKLDSILQQVYAVTVEDKLEEKGALFVVPALSLAPGELMNVTRYNRELAVRLLAQAGIPSAVEGGLLIAAMPLDRLSAGNHELLYIDLAGCDQVLRARIFELLMTQRLFDPDAGSLPQYVWKLIQNASPQTFKLYWQDGLTWLALANELS